MFYFFNGFIFIYVNSFYFLYYLLFNLNFYYVNTSIYVVSYKTQIKLILKKNQLPSFFFFEKYNNWFYCLNNFVYYEGKRNKKRKGHGFGGKRRRSKIHTRESNWSEINSYVSHDDIRPASIDHSKKMFYFFKICF